MIYSELVIVFWYVYFICGISWCRGMWCRCYGINFSFCGLGDDYDEVIGFIGNI